MKALLIASLVLLPLPALAESWMPSGVVLPDGSSLWIDANSVKRSWKQLDRIAYRVQVQGVAGSAEGRISGNCKTGNWRLSSGGKSAALILPAAEGARSLQMACAMGYQLTQPR